LITLVNIIIYFLAGFIYKHVFASPFPVNGLTTFYHCSDVYVVFSLVKMHFWFSSQLVIGL